MKKKHMEIYRADVMGFCYGVKRAMKIAEKAAKDGVKAVTYGPIIHLSLIHISEPTRH